MLDDRRYAIPTMFQGILYRSRLEARWASFFKLMGWSAHYEPKDFAGYIPDFIITSFAHDTVVEVKPASHFNEVGPHAKKIQDSGWEGDFIIVGSRLFNGLDASRASLGYYYQAKSGFTEDGLDVPHEDMNWSARGHAEVFFCNVCRRKSVWHTDGNWRCAVGGCRVDGKRAGHIGTFSFREADAMFKSSGNATQWRGEAATR